MKIWISILSLLALLASPVIYAEDSADSGKEASTETSADGKKKGGDGEEEPECD